MIECFGGELLPHGTNDRGTAGVKFPIVGTALIGYFWGELVPHGTNDRGGPVPDPLGTVLIGYFEERLVPYGTDILGHGEH